MENIEHEYTDEIVCPYCGYEFGYSYEYDDGYLEDCGLVECGECDKEFYAIRNISITYSTIKANYGTCKGCGTENIVLEDLTSSIGSYTSLCKICGRKELAKNLKKYFDELEGK